MARYEYDGLFRRVEKELSNQGDGIVYGSNPSGITGIQAGDRFERYYYAGWRVAELRDNYGSGNRTLGQFVYGTQYIDEPVTYDRNTDVTTGGSPDNDCVDSGGSQRYVYHQDVNYRVMALTREDGSVVERYEYSAYGEPVVLRGVPSGGSAESDAATYASTIGNPLTPQPGHPARQNPPPRCACAYLKRVRAPGARANMQKSHQIPQMAELLLNKQFCERLALRTIDVVINQCCERLA